MKKIIVPVDFSKYSEYALEVAATIAKQTQSEIIVIHMLGLSEAILTKNEDEEIAEAMYYMKLAEKRFTSFLDKTYLKGIPITETVQNYKIFSEISNFAKAQDANLIVMGSHGSIGFNEVFVGSNTEKVVRTSTTPVLVIKERITNFKIEKIVFACDFNIDNSHAFRTATQLFDFFNAQIHLLYVNLPGDHFRSSAQMEKRANEFLDIVSPGNTSYLNSVVYQNAYTIENGIYAYSEKIDADVIAIPTHGRRGLSHFFNGSIGEDIANHSNKPVMTFKI